MLFQPDSLFPPSLVSSVKQVGLPFDHHFEALGWAARGWNFHNPVSEAERQASPSPTVLQWSEASHLHPWAAPVMEHTKKRDKQAPAGEIETYFPEFASGEICHLGQPRVSGDPISYLSGGREEEGKRR